MCRKECMVMKIWIKIKHIAPLENVLGGPKGIRCLPKFREQVTAANDIAQWNYLCISTIGSSRPCELVEARFWRRISEWREPLDVGKVVVDLECIGELEDNSNLRGTETCMLNNP